MDESLEKYPALREWRMANLERKERELVAELERVRARIAEDRQNIEAGRDLQQDFNHGEREYN